MEAEADTPMREEEEDVSLSDLLARSKQHQTQQKRTLLERLGVPTLSATLDALQAAGLSEEPLASLANATAVVQKLTRVPLLALACSAPHLRVFMLRVLGYEDPDPAQAALVAQEVSCESCGAVCCAADCFCCKCGKPVASGRLAREELNSFRTEQPDSVSAQLTDIQFQALRLRHLVVFFGVVRASNVPVRYQFRVLTEIHTAVLSIVCTGLLQGPAGLQGTPDDGPLEPVEAFVRLLEVMVAGDEVYLPVGWGEQTAAGAETAFVCFRKHGSSVIARVDNVGPSKLQGGHRLFAHKTGQALVQSLGIVVASPADQRGWGMLVDYVTGIAGMVRPEGRQLSRSEALPRVYPPDFVSECRQVHRANPFLAEQLALCPPQPPGAAVAGSHLQGVLTRLRFTAGGVGMFLAFKRTEQRLAVREAALVRDGNSGMAVPASTLDSPRVAALKVAPCRECGYRALGDVARDGGMHSVLYWVKRFRQRVADDNSGAA
eukprot:TRINITY_DN24821_c0_g1_i2.p1 TRINITY_DN24821_c0_g1~~TRINITY_DN24821_c0_g1_i2.p1  ORF type:complete len:510 (+),score=183.40 TRINITY_DN24821_c0_g1_i2:59-1531(+)